MLNKYNIDDHSQSVKRRHTLQRGRYPWWQELLLVARGYFWSPGLLPLTSYSWSSRTSGLPTSFAGSASGLGMYLSIQPPSQLAM